MLPLDEDLWRTMEVMDRALTTGRREDRVVTNKLWCELSDDECLGDRMPCTQLLALQHPLDVVSRSSFTDLRRPMTDDTMDALCTHRPGSIQNMMKHGFAGHGMHHFG